MKLSGRRSTNIRDRRDETAREYAKNVIRLEHRLRKIAPTNEETLEAYHTRKAQDIRDTVSRSYSGDDPHKAVRKTHR